MEEIEVKILEINKKKIIAKLISLGTKKEKEGDIHAIHFDYPDNRLKKEKKVFRLRKIFDKVELTFKKESGKKYSDKDKSSAKIKEEIETYVDDFDTAEKIILNLGFMIRYEYKKKRTSFKLKDKETKETIHFEIDEYPEIPVFLEIEAPSTSLIKKYVKLLDYSMKDAKPWSGREVHEHYGKKL